MSIKAENQDPNTSVPREEETDSEAGGRSVEPNTSVPHDEPEPNTTVPHDDR